MKKYVLSTSGSGEVTFAIVSLDDDQLKRLAARRKAFLQNHQEDSELLFAEYWTDTARWFPPQEEDEDGAFEESLSGDYGFREVGPEFELTDEVDVELDTLRLDGFGVHWICSTKHSDEYFETSHIPWEVLLGDIL